MPLPHFIAHRVGRPRFGRSLRRLVLAALALALTLGVAERATAHDPELQNLLAPFECGTEWAGTTRPGHGLHDLNLDITRTIRPPGDPDHDLGQPLLAQADGTIVWIGWHVSAGTYVEIDYGDITARYVHLVDDSVPSHLEIGSEVTEGELFALLGDTGNATIAHLHLEYFDSHDYDDARAWLLPDENQIQIVMDGEPISPGEAFVSTNCGTSTPPSSTTTSTSSTTTTTTTTEPPHPFTDLDPDSFAYADVGLLYDLGITTGTAEDRYSPGHDVTREQMAAFLARLLRLAYDTEGLELDEFPFADVDESSFAHDDIHLIWHLGITTGTGPDTYAPGDVVSREQMAAFLARLHRLVDPVEASFPGESPFTDVDETSFAYDDIELIRSLGITTGTSETTYSPDLDVSREQMAAFLARLYRTLNPEPPVE